MTTLPRISELGLPGFERPTHSNEFVSAYNVFPTGETAARSFSSSRGHQLPAIQLPTLQAEQYSFCHSYSGPREVLSRRSSVDSGRSTPASAGSFSYSPAASDGWRTPNSATFSPRFRELVIKDTQGGDHVLQHDDLEKISADLRQKSTTPPASRSSARSKASSPARTKATSPARTKASGVQKAARRKPQKQEGEGHCNIKYNEEQGNFIIYCHSDLGMSWKQIEEAYNKQWPRGPTEPPRNLPGLQSILYRLNKEVPCQTEDSLLIFGTEQTDEQGQDDAPKYNQYDNQVMVKLIRGEGKVSLIDRYAEQLVDKNYTWMRPEDMERARALAAKRRPYRLAWEARMNPTHTAGIEAKL